MTNHQKFNFLGWIFFADMLFLIAIIYSFRATLNLALRAIGLMFVSFCVGIRGFLKTDFI